MDRHIHIEQMIESAARLRDRCRNLSFGGKVTTVYNPLEYAWAPYEQYLHRFASPPKKTVFIGMNPGPWGMAQTGVPFGEIGAVQNWLKIKAPVTKPENEIQKRPVTGFNCGRSEVSGRRVWGLMKKRFGIPENFFQDHFIANYCPLLFYDSSGKNLTPDKLKKEDREMLFSVCDEHIRETIDILGAVFLVGFGKFAENRLLKVTEDLPGRTQKSLTVLRVLHPSPANPHANRGWEEQAVRALQDAGLW